MITVAQAECVVAVAKHGSFRKAAAALYMALPAVSANVYKVERELSVVLFQRSNAGAVLTPGGNALLPHFEALLASHDAVMAKSAEISAGDSRVLRVASHRLGQVITLPPALKRLRDRVGPIEVDVVQASYSRIPPMILAGEVELGFGFRTFESLAIDPRLEEVVTGTSPIVVYMPPDHRLADLQVVTRRDLVGETVITTRAAAERAPALGRLSGRRAALVQVDDAQLALQMVSDGVGIAPMVAGLEALAMVPVVSRPLDEPLQVDTTLIRRTDRPLSTAGQALWDILTPD